jgi:hypothetical protein
VPVLPMRDAFDDAPFGQEVARAPGADAAPLVASTAALRTAGL